MKAVFIFSLSIITFGVKAWNPVKNPFEFMTPPEKIHTISDCMHVTSESGEFFFKKIPHLVATGNGVGGPHHYHHQQPQQLNVIDAGNPMTVCGLYVVTEPDKIVEITIKYLDLNCDTGGLMAFVDGWELNGQYFPGIKDHHNLLENRIDEFCNEHSHWPFIQAKRIFKSSQNAALLQYRIPIHGSFIANVHFIQNPEPCNILVEGISSFYKLKNHGRNQNCTLTALFPAVISLTSIHVGGKSNEKVNYECTSADQLEIGGSNGIDSYNMERTANVCGQTDVQGPEQSIFCGVTSLRLISSGHHHNEVIIYVRQADENDLDIATLICPL